MCGKRVKIVLFSTATTDSVGAILPKINGYSKCPVIRNANDGLIFRTTTNSTRLTRARALTRTHTMYTPTNCPYLSEPGPIEPSDFSNLPTSHAKSIPAQIFHCRGGAYTLSSLQLRALHSSIGLWGVLHSFGLLSPNVRGKCASVERWIKFAARASYLGLFRKIQ